MFTSIAKLRASSAIPARVSSVETMLRRVYKAYTPEMIFPVFLIAASNSLDDVEWVRSSSQTHINVTHLSPAINKLGLSEMSVLRSAAKATGVDNLTKQYVNAALSAFAGKTWDVNAPAHAWFKQHAVTVDGAPASASSLAVPATPTPVATPAKAAPKAKAAPAKTVAAKTAAPVAKASAAPIAVAVAAPTPAIKFTPVTATMQQRLDKLVAVGTSKDKRSQIIEATGQSFETILVILASAGALPAGKLDQLLASGLK